jgi:hypothetical protein
MKYQLVSPILVLFDGRLRSFDFDRKKGSAKDWGISALSTATTLARTRWMFSSTPTIPSWLSTGLERFLVPETTGAGDNLQKLKAAFRGFGEEKYVVIYPNGLSHFSVA